MNEEMIKNEDLEYDLETFDKANERAKKLLEARMKQFDLFVEGEEDGESNID